eukprot:TRINITY_DN31777_c0_g1_i1.p1 TRINITY_DN31777_c0_g1~~TRINITY_DN31777_c0_g1_i1.p1  ORF type:complete len:295 (+),score=34.62 TRINITY_DN31777_c0_g1_i1:44-886(+)
MAVAVPAWVWNVHSGIYTVLPSGMYTIMPCVHVFPTVLIQSEAELHASRSDDAVWELSREEMLVQPVHFGLHGDRSNFRILCLGDSLTAGFHCGGQKFEPYGRAMYQRLRAAGFHCDVAVCGYSGRTTHEMVVAMNDTLVDVCGCQGDGLAQILRNSSYDLVLIMSGTNDMSQGRSSGQIAEDLHTLHSACHSCSVPSVAILPPPAPLYSFEQELKRQDVAGRVMEMARHTPGIRACIDPAEAVPALQAACWDSDAFHFSPLGSRVLGCFLADRLLAELS